MKILEWVVYSSMFIVAVAMWGYMIIAFLATFLGAEPCLQQ